MQTTYFTYVWGPPGEPAWPLTFASKGARTNAKKLLSEGDRIYTVCTRREPTPEAHRGRVTAVYKVSDLEVNTADYDLPRKDRHPEFDSVVRFPYALHPISVHEIVSSDNIFSDLVGPLTPAAHLQAQSRIVELDDDATAALDLLERREISPALPNTEFGLGRIVRKNTKLAPKHQGSFVGQFADHAVWYVYTLVLRDNRRKPVAVKIGYSNDPTAREMAHNFPLATEVTGLTWTVDLKQPTSSEDAAREVEQAVIGQFRAHALASNGEILQGVEPAAVAAAIAVEMRNRRTR